MVQKIVDLDILEFLIEHKDKSFAINEIAKNLEKDYRNVYDTIKKMPSINITKSAGANLVSFDFTVSELLFQVENRRRRKIFKDNNIKIIYTDLYKINSQFILLLFGSRAKKTNRKKSDYDLLLISDTPFEIESKLELYPLDIHLTSISPAEFRQMLLSKEFTVVSEAVKHNIILFGAEDYYRFIQNAR